MATTRRDRNRERARGRRAGAVDARARAARDGIARRDGATRDASDASIDRATRRRLRIDRSIGAIDRRECMNE
jgi:hypothetical protein